MNGLIKKTAGFALVLAAALPSFADVYEVEVGQFEKLKINGNFSVVYKNLSDSTGFARYEGPAGNKDVYVFSTKNDGSLKVEPSDEKWGKPNLPVLYLYSDFLSSLESYSDQDVDVVSIAPCASFTVNLIGNGTISVDNIKCNNVSANITTGNGSIYLDGVCVNAHYRMVGAGLISADQLKAENVKCRILGTGSIGCWALNNLNVTGLGTTKIYYKGSPNIKKTGGGKLFELPEEINQTYYEKLGTPVPVEQSSYDEEEPDDDPDEEVIEVVEDDDSYQTIVTADD